MTKLTRTAVAFAGALMLVGGAVGTANAADTQHHARHAAKIHNVSTPRDACASTVRPPDGGWWSYNLNCPHG